MRLLVLQHLAAALYLPPPLRCLPRRALRASSPGLAPGKNSSHGLDVASATSKNCIAKGTHIFCHPREALLCFAMPFVQHTSCLMLTDHDRAVRLATRPQDLVPHNQDEGQGHWRCKGTQKGCPVVCCQEVQMLPKCIHQPGLELPELCSEADIIVGVTADKVSACPRPI